MRATLVFSLPLADLVARRMIWHDTLGALRRYAVLATGDFQRRACHAFH